MQTKPDKLETTEPDISPERAADLRAVNAVKKNYKDMLTGKYLSRTHGDQNRD